MTRPTTILGGHAIRNGRMNADLSVALGTSLLVNVADAEHVSVELRSPSDTRAGTIYFRVSNSDLSTPIAMSTPTVTVSNGAGLDALVELPVLTSKFLEIFFDQDSGDGYLSAFVHVKFRKR